MTATGVQHRDATPEFTLPAFGWRMRPDPAYGLATLLASEAGLVSAHMTLCRLPHEHIVLAQLGAGASLLAYALVSSALAVNRPRQPSRKSL